jgi:hypothetical protein
MGGARVPTGVNGRDVKVHYFWASCRYACGRIDFMKHFMKGQLHVKTGTILANSHRCFITSRINS